MHFNKQKLRGTVGPNSLSQSNEPKLVQDSGKRAQTFPGFWKTSPNFSRIVEKEPKLFQDFRRRAQTRPGFWKNEDEKKIWNASRICVSSLRRGHANLLCIVPILVYVHRNEHIVRNLRSI